MLCYYSCDGVGGVSVGTNTGTNTGASVSDGVGVIMDRDRDRDIGGVLKNGFGILKFAEAPNLFRPRGVYIGGRGASR